MAFEETHSSYLEDIKLKIMKDQVVHCGKLVRFAYVSMDLFSEGPPKVTFIFVDGGKVNTELTGELFCCLHRVTKLRKSRVSFVMNNLIPEKERLNKMANFIFNAMNTCQASSAEIGSYVTWSVDKKDQFNVAVIIDCLLASSSL